MQKTLLKTSTGEWDNTVVLPDDWTGAEGEWQVPDGYEFVDGNGSTGFIWDGTQFVDPNQIIEEEQAEINWDEFRIKRNALLDSSDWTQGNDSPLIDEAKAEWATYRGELRDLPASTADPVDPTWPEVPE